MVRMTRGGGSGLGGRRKPPSTATKRSGKAASTRTPSVPRPRKQEPGAGTGADTAPSPRAAREGARGRLRGRGDRPPRGGPSQGAVSPHGGWGRLRPRRVSLGAVLLRPLIKTAPRSGRGPDPPGHRAGVRVWLTKADSRRPHSAAAPPFRGRSGSSGAGRPAAVTPGHGTRPRTRAGPGGAPRMEPAPAAPDAIADRRPGSGRPPRSGGSSVSTPYGLGRPAPL